MSFSFIPRNSLLVLFALSTFLSSCKKDKDNSGPGKGPVPDKKIAGIQQDASNFINFFYDTDGSLQKITLAAEDIPGGVQAIQIYYGENKRISSVYMEDGSHINYRYENAKLSQTETKDAAGVIISSTSYFYRDGRLEDFGVFTPFPLDDVPGGIRYERVRESHYVYNNDNTIRSIRSGLRNPLTDRMEIAGNRIYEKYDNKINPLRLLPDFSYVFFEELNPSNVVKEVSYDEHGSVEEIVERTYTYDEFGYPLTCVEVTKETGKAPETKTLKFTYK